MRSSVLLLAAGVLASFGCQPPRRVANQSWVLAIQVAPVNASGEGGGEAQTVGGVYAMVQGAETDRDWVSTRGRADVGLGGNANGFAGQLTLDGQVGFALWDAADHVFGRIGLFGTLEGDPVTGYSVLELPTLWLGYQHHGRRVDDTVHFDVGPRLSFGIAGRASSPGGRADFVAAPGVGGAALLMAEFVTLELTYERVFEASPLDIVRGSACFAFALAICVDTRHIFADFGSGWDATAYYGVRLGVGIASGKSPPF